MLRWAAIGHLYFTSALYFQYIYPSSLLCMLSTLTYPNTWFCVASSTSAVASAFFNFCLFFGMLNCHIFKKEQTKRKAKSRSVCVCLLPWQKTSRSSLNNDFIAQGKGRFTSDVVKEPRALRPISWLEGSTNDVTLQTAAYFLLFCLRSCYPCPGQRHILSHVCPNLIRS